MPSPQPPRNAPTSQFYLVQLRELPAVCDHHILACCATATSNFLNLFDNLHALGNVAENNVLAIKPVSFHGAEEKLGPICPGSCVGHCLESKDGSGVKGKVE